MPVAINYRRGPQSEIQTVAAGALLDFQGGRYQRGRRRYASFTAVPGVAFARSDTAGASRATARTVAGAVLPFASGVPRITDQGLLLSDVARTNKVTCYNANPDASLVSTQKTGDAAATLTRVLDTAALAAAGLGAVASSGYVFKLDNSAGSTTAIATFNGAVGNLNSHTLSAWIRGTGAANSGRLRLNGVATAIFFTPTASYVRLTNTQTPGSTSDGCSVWAAAGAVFYILLPSTFEGSTAPQDVVTTGAVATAAADAATITIPAGCTGWTATYNGGAIASGSATAGASFDLVTGRAWANGYLQQIRFA